MSAESDQTAIDIALEVAGALTRVGADYFLGGSLASSLQGEPRATNDIDFVISLPAGRIDALRVALGPDFDVDTDMLRDAVLHARTANVLGVAASAGCSTCPSARGAEGRVAGRRR